MDSEGQVYNDRIPEIQSTIISNLGTSLPFVPQIAEYLVETRYNTLRSRLTIRCASLFGETDSTILDIAGILEYLHAASLLHRWVRKPGESRRKLKPIEDIWGNEASVLLGDYLLSRSFEILSDNGNLDILDTVSNATQKIALGQILEISQPFPSLEPADCWKIMELKTASLFEAGALCAACWGGATNDTVEILRNFAKHLGMASALMTDLKALSDREILAEALRDEKLLYPVSHWLHDTLPPKDYERIIKSMDPSCRTEPGSEIWRDLKESTGNLMHTKIEEQFSLAGRQLEVLTGHDSSALKQLLSFDNHIDSGHPS